MTGTLALCGHLGDGFVRVGAEDDDVHPALEVAGYVGDGFALAEGFLGLVDEDGVAAEGVHRGLKGEACAERGLFEEEDHLLGVERVAEVFGRELDGVRELEDGGEFVGREVGDGGEVAADHALGDLGEGGVGLNAEGAGFAAVAAPPFERGFMTMVLLSMYGFSGQRGGVGGGVFGQQIVERGDGLVDVLRL